MGAAAKSFACVKTFPIVIITGGRRTGKKPRSTLASSARVLVDGYDGLGQRALLLHTGDATIAVDDGIVAAPWWRVL